MTSSKLHIRLVFMGHQKALLPRQGLANSSATLHCLELECGNAIVELRLNSLCSGGKSRSHDETDSASSAPSGYVCDSPFA